MKNLQICNTCHTYVMHFLVKYFGSLLGSQSIVMVNFRTKTQIEKLKKFMCLCPLIKLYANIAIIFLKYKICKWLFSNAFMVSTRPKIPSQGFYEPWMCNHQEAVHSCEIYVYTAANFTLAQLCCKEAFIYICPTFHPSVLLLIKVLNI